MNSLLTGLSLIGLLSLCSEFSARKLIKTGRTENGIEIPEVDIEYLYVHVDIRFRYARTRIMSQLVNHGETSNQAKFWITIPRDAFITDFMIEVNGIRQIGQSVAQILSQKLYCGLKGVDEMIGVVKLVEAGPREWSNPNQYELNVNLKANQRLNLTLAYEGNVDRIAGGGGNTEYKLSIKAMPEHMHAVRDFKIVAQIEDGKAYFRIPNFKTKWGTLIEPNMTMVKPDPGQASKLVWAPTSEQIRELADAELLGSAVIEYYIPDDGSSNGVLMVRDGYLIDRDKFSIKTDVDSLVPKHVIFVLDVSASMYGTRLSQLKSGMKEILDSMKNSSNYIDIVAFSNVVNTWNPLEPGTDVAKLQELIPSNPDYKNYAMSFINNLQARGSTNIYSALKSALALAERATKKTDHNENPYPSTIIFFVTDGEPTSGIINNSTILRLLRSLNQKLRVPIYSLAFGSEADYELCKNISEQSGGLARKVFDNGDAPLRFQEFYTEIISESLQNVTYQYVSPTNNLTEITHETFHPLIQRIDGKEKLITEFSIPPAIVFDATVMDMPCAEKCFMEKLHAYKRISRIYNSNEARQAKPADVCQISRASKKHPEYSEAMELGSKYEFVTRCRSLVAVGPESKKYNENIMRTENCD